MATYSSIDYAFSVDCRGAYLHTTIAKHHQCFTFCVAQQTLSVGGFANWLTSAAKGFHFPY